MESGLKIFKNGLKTYGVIPIYGLEEAVQNLNNRVGSIHIRE